MLDLRTCASLSEAAGILSGDRQALLIGGGTLVMRDVNEGRLTEGTLVRVTDPAFRQMSTSGARVELGAGVTMAMLLANRDLAFLHAAARAIGVGLWKGGDRGVIETGIVNLSWKVVGAVAAVVRRVQTGYLYHYAFVMIVGVLAFMTYFVWLAK